MRAWGSSYRSAGMKILSGFLGFFEDFGGLLFNETSLGTNGI